MQKKSPIIKKIGQYELIKEIGSGAFSRVYKSRLVNSEKEFAIKMIQKKHLK